MHQRRQHQHRAPTMAPRMRATDGDSGGNSYRLRWQHCGSVFLLFFVLFFFFCLTPFFIFGYAFFFFKRKDFSWSLLFACNFMSHFPFLIFVFSGVHSTHLPSLDAKLMPEHLFYLCLDYRKKYLLSHKSATRYNFYKVLSNFLYFGAFDFFTFLFL